MQKSVATLFPALKGRATVREIKSPSGAEETPQANLQPWRGFLRVARSFRSGVVPRHLALCAALFFTGSLTCADPPTVNLVAPLSDAKRWHLQVFGKAKATLTRAGDVLVLHTSAVDGTDYNAQLQSVGPSLTEGQTYTLHFQAKANAKRSLPVYALVNQGDYHGIGLREVASLSTHWRTFEYTFLAKDLGDGRKLVCPQFTLGNAVGTVYLAGISLVPAAPGTALTPPPDDDVWDLQKVAPADASVQNENGSHIVLIRNSDGEPWHVQLNHLGGGVQDGQVYTVHFRAKADAPRDMMLSGQVGDGDYHNILDQQYILINTDWRDYSYRVTPHNGKGHSVLFPQFLLGKQPGTVWIDQVTVESPDDPKDDVIQRDTPDVSASPVVFLVLPHKGEICLNGTISANGFTAHGFTLMVQQTIQPDSSIVTLPSPRPKVVRLSVQTRYRALSDNVPFAPTSLKPGESVSVLGPDSGIGKPLGARLILR